MRLLFATLLAGVAFVAQAAEQPVLTVYTYSSFTADWGPGPAVKHAFEARCECTLDYVALGDGAALLSRIRLEGAHSRADVVLGLDTSLTAEAAASGLFAPHGLDLSSLTLPVAWHDDVFVPFDYGYFAFVYDKTKLANPPTSMAALANGDAVPKIVIEDPRTSTPGLGLLLWMRKLYGDQAGAAWTRLSHRVLTVSKGWSAAYSLFLKGEAPLVLSYTTSPAYHAIAERDTRFAAAMFTEGNYLQMEVAGRLAGSSHPRLADQFLKFMISAGFQQYIPTGNWMYPVIALPGGLPPAFKALPVPARALTFSPAEVAAHRKAWIDDWLQAMIRR